MVEERTAAPAPALLASGGRDHHLRSPAQDMSVLPLSSPERLPPEPCTVPGSWRLPKMLRGSWCCPAPAQIPSLPAGCLASAAHEAPSGSGNGFFFFFFCSSKLHLVFSLQISSKGEGILLEGGKRKHLQVSWFIFSSFPKEVKPVIATHLSFFTSVLNIFVKNEKKKGE